MPVLEPARNIILYNVEQKLLWLYIFLKSLDTLIDRAWFTCYDNNFIFKIDIDIATFRWSSKPDSKSIYQNGYQDDSGDQGANDNTCKLSSC